MIYIDIDQNTTRNEKEKKNNEGRKEGMKEAKN